MEANPVAELCFFLWFSLWLFSFFKFLVAAKPEMPYAGYPHKSSEGLYMIVSILLACHVREMTSFKSLPIFFLYKLLNVNPSGFVT